MARAVQQRVGLGLVDPQLHAPVERVPVLQNLVLGPRRPVVERPLEVELGHAARRVRAVDGAHDDEVDLAPQVLELRAVQPVEAREQRRVAVGEERRGRRVRVVVRPDRVLEQVLVVARQQLEQKVLLVLAHGLDHEDAVEAVEEELAAPRVRDEVDEAQARAQTLQVELRRHAHERADPREDAGRVVLDRKRVAHRVLRRQIAPAGRELGLDGLGAGRVEGVGQSAVGVLDAALDAELHRVGQRVLLVPPVDDLALGRLDAPRRLLDVAPEELADARHAVGPVLLRQFVGLGDGRRGVARDVERAVGFLAVDPRGAARVPAIAARRLLALGLALVAWFPVRLDAGRVRGQERDVLLPGRGRRRRRRHGDG